MRKTAKITPSANPVADEQQRLERIVSAAQATKAEDIVVFDLENRSTICDRMMICSGRSQGHVRGIADNIEEALRESGIRCTSMEGYQEGSWVLLDFGLVLVHVFHPETRAYYDLEDLLKEFPSRRYESENPGLELSPAGESSSTPSN